MKTRICYETHRNCNEATCEREALRVVVRWESDASDGEVMTWSEFEAANAGGMEPETLARVRAACERGEIFEGGGGAAPAYTVRRAANV